MSCEHINLDSEVQDIHALPPCVFLEHEDQTAWVEIDDADRHVSFYIEIDTLGGYERVAYLFARDPQRLVEIIVEASRVLDMAIAAELAQRKDRVSP